MDQKDAARAGGENDIWLASLESLVPGDLETHLQMNSSGFLRVRPRTTRR